MRQQFELRHIVAISVLLAGSMAFAQTAEITGRVIDTSGGVVPGAGVTVLSLASGMDRDIPTNSEGYYTVPLLLPGEYRITVQHAGFKPIVRSGVVLAVDQRAELNFTLEVGSAMEKIEVQADAPQLNTVEASQGQVIENKRIVELPLNGRTYDDLALLSAGTVQPLSNARYSGFSSGGMRDTQNNFLLDGLDNTRLNWRARSVVPKWCSRQSTAYRSSRFRPVPMLLSTDERLEPL